MKQEDWKAVLFVCSISIGLFISCILSAYLSLAFFFGAGVGAFVGIYVFSGHLQRFRVKTLKALLFVEHIEKHLGELGGGQKVVCKICGKTIDEIYEEEGQSDEG